METSVVSLSHDSGKAQFICSWTAFSQGSPVVRGKHFLKESNVLRSSVAYYRIVLGCGYLSG